MTVDLVAVPRPTYAHLIRLTNEGGLHEHAEFTKPRPEHGYCVDDVARGLIVVVREPAQTPTLEGLSRQYLHFILAAQASDGRFHNRPAIPATPGCWQDEPSTDDCWGRALWALGSAASHAPALARPALVQFERSAHLRSPWLRATTFAALGAAEVLLAQPGHPGARALLQDAASAIGSPPGDPMWLWPEARLQYANAALPEVLLRAGHLLGDTVALNNGLDMLTWLLGVETAGDHLSITPVGGWVRGEPRPAFDQQPIELAALADVCAVAFTLTGQPRWRDAVLRCAAWFLGANDAATPLHDNESGGCCDGLERAGRNENQGAESTLAMLSTFQQGQRLLISLP